MMRLMLIAVTMLAAAVAAQEIAVARDENTRDDTYVLRLVARGGVEIGSPASTRLIVRDRQDVPAVPLAGLVIGLLLVVAGRARAPERR